MNRDTHLRVFMVLEGAPEPVGYVHVGCRDNVPDTEDGFEMVVDAMAFDDELPVHRDPTECMYHNEQETT